MTDTGSLQVTTPSDREVCMTRSFNAPRDLVFAAWTKPELVMRWLGVEAWPMVVCEIDLRVGGVLRYVWRNKDGTDMGINGVFQQIVPPERLVHTELFEEDWTDGETQVTTTFTEQDGRTTVSMVILYASKAARDGAMKTGMADGMAEGYRSLDILLANIPAGLRP